MRRRAKNEEPTTTFDFRDGEVRNSEFSDINSSADKAVIGGSSERNVFRRFVHTPRGIESGINWTKWGAIAAIAAIPVSVAIALLPH